MSIGLEPRVKRDDFAALEQGGAPTKLDDAAAVLEKELRREIDLRREERFLWTFAVTLLLDIIAFPNLGWGMVPVFLLELVFLIFLAKWLGVDQVAVLLERILNRQLADTGTKPKLADVPPPGMPRL